VPVPWNAQCCEALYAHVNRLEIGGCVFDMRNTGGTTLTISVRTFLAVSLLVNSLENGGGPPPVLALRVRVLLLTSCTTGALTQAKSEVPDWGIKSTLAWKMCRLWSGNKERSCSQLQHGVPRSNRFTRIRLIVCER
jgi:hypothetical protein